MLSPLDYHDLIRNVATTGELFQRALVQTAAGYHEQAVYELTLCLELIRKEVPEDEAVVGEGFLLYLLGYSQDATGKWDSAIANLTRVLEMVQASKDASKKITKTRKHEFRVKSFLKPTFCCKCKKLLTGLTKQGLECVACKQTIHNSCVASYALPCSVGNDNEEKEKGKEKEQERSNKGAKGSSNAHEFEVTQFYVPTFCSQCSKLLVGFSKQGLTCKKCGAVVHEKCSHYMEPCFEALEHYDSKLTLSDVLGLRGLAYYHSSLYEEAIRDFEAALACKGEDMNESQRAVFIGNLGLAHYYRDEEETALKLFTEAIDMGLKQEQLFSLRAVIHQLHGRDAEALEDRQQALMLSSTAQLNVFPYALPPEVELYVLSFLPKSDLANSCLVCKRWYTLIKVQPTPCRWWTICTKAFP